MHRFSSLFNTIKEPRERNHQNIANGIEAKCPPKCLKYFLNSYWISWMILGILFIIAGVKNLRFDVFGLIAPINLFNFSAFINLVIGVVILIASLAAYIFLLLRSRYIFFLFVIILTFVGIIFLIVYGIVNNSVENEKENMRHIVTNIWIKRNNSEMDRIFQMFQEELQCCGLSSAKDWSEIPESCCELKRNPCDESLAYKDNCIHKALSLIELNMLFMKLLVVVTSIAESLSLILVLRLFYPFKIRGVAEEDEVENFTS